ncbi:hypothetical protein C4579_01155 [Candidatus Microgenomates bacterium]|nr:MAG: hypothetical protein C4579_01155 [Candidatus Microgenomates bacterium]
MSKYKQIQQEMVDMEALQVLSKIYADIASVRMKQTRDEVLHSRMYMESLTLVFEQIRAAFAKDIRKLMRFAHKKEGLTVLAHNGKTVAVFLSANAGLYGPIVPETFNLFASAIHKRHVEATIIGKQGLSLFLSEFPNTPYTYFDLPDHGDLGKFSATIINHIVQYDQVELFYGKFQSVIVQKPTETTISSLTQLPEKEVKDITHYFLEPDLETVLMFFEKELFTSVFEQAVFESRLAKYASRIIAMDEANERIKTVLKKMRLMQLTQQHRLQNRKQLNRLPSVLFTKEEAWYE